MNAWLTRGLLAICLFAALISTPQTPSLAYQPPPSRTGEPISLIYPDRPTPVRMQSAQFEISVGYDEAIARAAARQGRPNYGAVAVVTSTFVLSNTSSSRQQVRALFPVARHWTSAVRSDVSPAFLLEDYDIHGLTFRIDDAFVPWRHLRPAELHASAKDNRDIAWAAVDLRFAALEQMRVTTAYTVSTNDQADQSSLIMLLSIGANWQWSGDIDRVSVTIQMPYTVSDLNFWQFQARASDSFMWPYPIQMGASFAGDHVLWSRTAFKPQIADNLVVGFIAPQHWLVVLGDREAVQFAPQDADAWLALSRAYQQPITRFVFVPTLSTPSDRGLNELARQALERSIQLNSGQTKAYDAYFVCLILPSLFDRSPNNPDALHLDSDALNRGLEMIEFELLHHPASTAQAEMRLAAVHRLVSYQSIAANKSDLPKLDPFAKRIAALAQRYDLKLDQVSSSDIDFYMGWAMFSAESAVSR